MLRGAGEFEPVIAELTRNAATHFGSADVEIEPLRRINGPYSSVLNVRVSGGDAPSRAFIKIFRPRGNSETELSRIGRFLEREFRVTTALHEALASQSEIGALRPIAYLPEHRAIVTAEVPGRHFGDLLGDLLNDGNDGSANRREVLKAARRIGQWVKAYQGIAPAAGSIQLGERRAYIDDRLHQLEGRVLTTQDREGALAYADELSALIGDSVPAVGIHADLTPANVLVEDEGRVTVLDFTMAKTGTPLHDLAHLCFHVSSFALRHRSEATLADDVRRAILEGYDASLTLRDPLFRLMLLQHAVCHIAMLAERRVPIGARAYRWYLRRRWKRVERIAA